MTVTGEFLERAEDAHRALRDELLAASRTLPGIPARLLPEGATAPSDAPRKVAARVAEHGVGVVRLRRALTDDEYLAVGEALGRPMPETDPAARRHTDRDVILNLRSSVGHTDDVSLQPFATNPLTMHSEGSGRALPEQPRYIALMCVDPGTDEDAPRTVLTSMEDVAARLSAAELDLLARIRYRNAPGVPTVARRAGGRTVFSFRDFHTSAVRWETVPGADGADPVPGEVEAALRRLLQAMYTEEGTFAVHWTAGLLVVIDNFRHFHARTGGSARPGPQPRHLKRLRILGG